MAAGKLAAAKPAATTNTTLYSCPIDKATSAVLQVANQSGSASSYRVALRDYNQIVTLDGSSYKLRKGNVVTSYTATISPGISTDQAAAGSKITTTGNLASFKYHDIFKPTSTITYDVKVASIGTVAITAGSTVGTFAVGNTITGATSGQTATIYRVDTTSLYVNIADVSSAATSVRVNNATGLAANDFLSIGNAEIVRIGAVSGNNLTGLTRAQLGTSATAITGGSVATGIRAGVTTTTINEGATFSTSDGILTVTNATTLAVVVGDYIRVDNELMQVGGIVGNDISVTRGSLGTIAATHSNGATVTRYTAVTSTIYANFFNFTENITASGGATGVLSITSGSGAPYSSGNRFVYDLGIGVYSFPAFIPIDADRVVKFTQSDSSNTGHPLRFSSTSDGTWGGGVEWTTGVTRVGTPGSGGAYSQIDLSLSNIGATQQMYLYCEFHAQMTLNGYLFVDLSPNYTTMYLYDLEGTLTANDTFTVGSVNYTITAVNPGPYGYVQDRTNGVIKVSLGTNSSAFTTYTTTVSAGTTGQFTFTVASATNLVVGMAASGTGIGTGARITSIVGTTVTVDVANSGTVSGTGTFNFTFYDCPRTTAALRTLATVSSYTDINAEDYILYDKAITGNTTEKNSGIVVGPGQSLMVYSTNNTISYLLNGFEDTTTDFTVVQYIRNAAAV
jgi:hypothetical protein